MKPLLVQGLLHGDRLEVRKADSHGGCAHEGQRLLNILLGLRSPLLEPSVNRGALTSFASEVKQETKHSLRQKTLLWVFHRLRELWADRY